MTLVAGAKLGPYEILSPLGAGGMGEVYRARDSKLKRDVAIKVLPQSLSADPDALARFEREAVAVAALSHPNILAIHDFGNQDGVAYAVMELLEGETLRDKLDAGPIPQKRAVDYALQVAKGLSAAHEKGIVHRDLKPENLFVSRVGHLKILDFGLAKRVEAAVPGEVTKASTVSGHTEPGSVMGTVGYMSPEQVRGLPVDHRSDIFSFGTILYELLSGKRAFSRATAADTMSAIMKEEPPELSESGRNITLALDHIVKHCLEKDRDNRFQSARDIAFDLSEQSSQPLPTVGSGDRPPARKLKSIILKLLGEEPARRSASVEEVHAETRGREASRPPGVSRNARLGVAAAVVVAVAISGLFLHRWFRQRWALETATPEIARLVGHDDFAKAVALLREARTVLPRDPTLEKLWIEATWEVTVESVPSDADVSIRLYRGDANAWVDLGRTPLQKIRVPRTGIPRGVGGYVWRISKPGFAAVSRIGLQSAFRLPPADSVPPGMVPVPGGEVRVEIPGLALPMLPLDDYLIDRHEVTNEEYKEFVDAGGYQKLVFWKQPFVKDGKTLGWEQAVGLFRDTTGRPGPATWEVGGYPKGLGKHPVAGISWYEASAYADFAGKTLPTLYHWTRAAQEGFAMLIVPGSNFSGAGTAPVEGPGALSGFGTTDMAGNVKEWCWNESQEGKRFIMGGGFGEPQYMFTDADARSPWGREPNYGVRCVKLASPPPPATIARVVPDFRDFSKERPVSDEVFKAFRRIYSYDKTPLDARVEETKAAEDWTREKVSFDAAYGGERVTAYLYLPKGAIPPFQTVVFFPGSNALFLDKFDDANFYWDFLPKSGRALMFPIYKSTYERRDGLNSDYPAPTAFWRDHMIAWSKDLGRSLDYLETRKDIDHTKVAYFGVSWGSVLSPVLLAGEERFKTAILAAGGLTFQKALPEADQINFVNHVRIPVLMVSGRYDNFLPLESSQRPLFRLLGTPEADKRHIIYESGHGVLGKDLIHESLDWLDKYLGPVKH